MSRLRVPFILLLGYLFTWPVCCSDWVSLPTGDRRLVPLPPRSVADASRGHASSPLVRIHVRNFRPRSAPWPFSLGTEPQVTVHGGI